MSSNYKNSEIFLDIFLVTNNSISIFFHGIRVITIASSSSTTSNPNSVLANQTTQISFSFSTLVKLDQSNFLLWRKKVLSSIRGYQPEDFISSDQIVPKQYISQTVADGLV